MPVLVLAHAHDPEARRLITRWPGDDALLLTPRDLSRSGWVLHDGDPGASRCVVGRRVVPTREVTGVLTRMGRVGLADLPHVREPDRGYCAAEMTAFLRWWLVSLPCAVVNRPSVTSLCGPGWSALRWQRTAARLGIPCVETVWDSLAATAGPGLDVDDLQVVGTRVVSGPAVEWATGLAEAAGATNLRISVDVSGPAPAFITADPWVDLRMPAVVERLQETLGDARVPEPWW